MREVVLQVSGMACRHCVRSVSRQVGRLPGIDAFSVDLPRSVVVVQGSAPDWLLTSAVERAGFDCRILLATEVRSTGADGPHKGE